MAQHLRQVRRTKFGCSARWIWKTSQSHIFICHVTLVQSLSAIPMNWINCNRKLFLRISRSKYIHLLVSNQATLFSWFHLDRNVLSNSISLYGSPKSGILCVWVYCFMKSIPKNWVVAIHFLTKWSTLPLLPYFFWWLHYYLALQFLNTTRQFPHIN